MVQKDVDQDQCSTTEGEQVTGNESGLHSPGQLTESPDEESGATDQKTVDQDLVDQGMHQLTDRLERTHDQECVNLIDVELVLGEPSQECARSTGAECRRQPTSIAVRQANEIGIQKSKLPNSLHDVDNETTLILENSDYKEFIVHKTGHGLGLDVHEDPYVVRGNDTKLEQGMVITIEPGLYIPKKFGIRIEDDVLITNDKPNVLTSFSKDLRIINNE